MTDAPSAEASLAVAETNTAAAPEYNDGLIGQCPRHVILQRVAKSNYSFSVYGLCPLRPCVNIKQSSGPQCVMCALAQFSEIPDALLRAFENGHVGSRTHSHARCDRRPDPTEDGSVFLIRNASVHDLGVAHHMPQSTAKNARLMRRRAPGLGAAAAMPTRRAFGRELEALIRQVAEPSYFFLGELSDNAGLALPPRWPERLPSPARESRPARKSFPESGGPQAHFQG